MKRIGILLFFLVAGLNEYALKLEHSFLPWQKWKTNGTNDTMLKKRNEFVNGGLHDTLNGSNRKSLLQLNFIPNQVVRLASGDHVQLQKLIDQRKYIFIHVWSGRRKDEIFNVKAVDSVAEVYRNKLLVIGLLDDGNLKQLNKLIKKYHLKNVQGLLPADIKKYLNVNVYPYGILFSKTGKLIESGMDEVALSAYLEKHVVVSRAKF